jgi:hypothetical protein
MRAVSKTISGLAAAAALALCAAPASAATVFSAGWEPGCGKATCFNDKGVYTHAWSASGAAGPVTVGQLLLDRGVLGSLDSSIFRLSFQVDGQKVGAWGSYMMAGIGGDVLSFTGEEFVWNPQAGDLVLVLELAQFGRGGPGGGFSALAANRGGGGGSGGGAFTLQNIPDTQGGPTGGAPSLDERLLAAAVPEPASWALMIGGFGLAGAGLRRRRTALPAEA